MYDVFGDVLKSINFDKNKILIVVPFISQYAIDKWTIGLNRYLYHKIIYDHVMNYWWKDISVTIYDQIYDLNRVATSSTKVDISLYFYHIFIIFYYF